MLENGAHVRIVVSHLERRGGHDDIGVRIDPHVLRARAFDDKPISRSQRVADLLACLPELSRSGAGLQIVVLAGAGAKLRGATYDRATRWPGGRFVVSDRRSLAAHA